MEFNYLQEFFLRLAYVLRGSCVLFQIGIGAHLQTVCAA